MIQAPAGILLPASTLSSPWFTVLATAVAFNTIIYLGLTISKLIPWPRQLHPSRVRAWLSRAGASTEQESAVDDIPVPALPESDDPYEAMRRGIARRDIPQAFALVGGLVILLSLAGLLTFSVPNVGQHVAELAFGVALLITAQVLGRRHFRATTIRWTWAAASTLLVLLMCREAMADDSALPLTYAFIIMTAFPSVTMAWRPSLTAAVVMLAVASFVSIQVSTDQDGRLIIAALAALLTGAALLRLRLVAVDAISTEEARANALATTDLLTGALTRQGLLTLIPGMAATAERAGQEVCVMVFDVDRLAQANADYGMQYGDEVLRAVTAAITATVRQGDLVARWDGGTFLVAGIGSKPSADALGARIQEAVRLSGINLGKWPTTVSVGTAAGDPAETTFDALVGTAVG